MIHTPSAPRLRLISPRFRIAEQPDAIVLVHRSHGEMIALPLLELRQRDGHRQVHRLDVANQPPRVRRRRLRRLLVRIDLIRRDVRMLAGHLVHRPRYHNARVDVQYADDRPRRTALPTGRAVLLLGIRQRCRVLARPGQTLLLLLLARTILADRIRSGGGCRVFLQLLLMVQLLGDLLRRRWCDGAAGAAVG